MSEEVDECRICLEPSGNLISICECKGTCQFVHEECITRWINRFSINNKKHHVCQICNSNYKLELLNGLNNRNEMSQQNKFILCIRFFWECNIC